MNEIKLKFDPTLGRATGRDFGRYIYKEQVKPNIKEDEMNQIIFPDNITAIGISFARGLMEAEVSKYGKEGLFKHFEFKSKSVSFVKKIVESVQF